MNAYQVKVLVSSYAHVGLGRGGMIRQIECTVESLRSAGVSVHYHCFCDNFIDDFDLLHIFSLDASSMELARAFKSRGKPVIISSVFNAFGKSFLRKSMEISLPRLIPGFLPNIRVMRELIEMADLVIVLNQEELTLLAEYFPAVRAKATEIPNGFSDNTEYSPQIAKVPDLVLNVAEINQRKNQLNLVRAALNADWKLAIVGKIPQTDYARACTTLALGQKNVTFTGELPYRSKELNQYYAAAKVFCLPSHSEVQPLAIIEAAKRDCELVVSETIPVDLRVRSASVMCNPKKPNDIRRAIEEALSLDSGNATRVAKYPTWDEVAKALLDKYLKALS